VIRTVDNGFAGLAVGFGNIPEDGGQGLLEDCVDVSLIGVLHRVLGNSQKGHTVARCQATLVVAKVGAVVK
jgi:hypothetical protein